MYLVALEGGGISAITSVTTELFGVMSSVLTTVTGNPVLCIGIAATVGGIGISWYKRLTNQRSGRRRP